MNKKLIILLFFILVDGFSQSIEPKFNIDSLVIQADSLYKKGKYLTASQKYKKVLQLIPDDSVEKKIDIYYRISKSYITGRAIDSANFYIDKANQMVVDAMSVRTKFLKEYTNAAYHHSLHQDDKAMAELLNALGYAKTMNNNKHLFKSNLLLGKILLKGKAFKRAKKAIDKALIYAKQSNNIDNIAVANFYLGNYYFDLKQNDEADKYLRMALSGFEKSGNIKGLILTKSYIGQLYIRKGNNIKGMKWTMDSFKLLKQLELSGSAKKMMKIAKKQVKVYKSNESDSVKLMKASKLTEQSMKIAKEQDAVLNIESASRDIIRNQQKNNTSEVKLIKKLLVKNADSIIKLKDSIWENRLNAKYAELEQKYQAEKKELENKKLISENKLKEMALNNEKAAKKRWLYSAIILGVILLLVGILLFGIVKQKRRIEQMNNEISKQNKLIMQLHKDMHHRIKGNLGMISAIISRLEIDPNNTKLEKQIIDLQNRIVTIEDIHRNLLYDDNMSTHISVKPYIQKAVNRIANTFADKNIRTDIKIDENLQIHGNIAFIIALITNEFVTNSYKYAFNEKGGVIEIDMYLKQNTYYLSLSDNGKGLPDDIDIDDLDSFGLEIIKLFAEVQLEGTFSITGHNGTKINITFPNKLT